MQLPQFLKRVDTAVSAMSAEELRSFIHEIARTYQSDDRKKFIQVLSAQKRKTSKTDKANKTSSLSDFDRIKIALKAINAGEKTLDSDDDPQAYDYNYEEDFYNYVFYDPDKLLPDVEFALDFVRKSVNADPSERTDRSSKKSDERNQTFAVF